MMFKYYQIQATDQSIDFKRKHLNTLFIIGCVIVTTIYLILFLRLNNHLSHINTQLSKIQICNLARKNSNNNLDIVYECHEFIADPNKIPDPFNLSSIKYTHSINNIKLDDEEFKL